MDRWLLSFTLGAILSLFLAIVPEIFYVNLFTGLALGCAYWKKTRAFAFFFAGLAVVLGQAVNYNSTFTTHFASNDKIQNVVLVGEVTEVTTYPFSFHPVASKKLARENIPNLNQRFVLLADEINGVPAKPKLKVKLNWSESRETVKVGQQWQLAVRIKPAHGFANQGGFAYQTWLRVKQIHTTGYVRKNAKNLLLQTSYSFREWWKQKLIAALPHSQQGSLVLALGFGERQGILPEQWQLLQNTGTAHLLAISGMHLSLVALGASLIFFALLRGVCLTQHQVMSMTNVGSNFVIPLLILVMATTLLYAYMADFSLPTLRALLMIVLVFSAKFANIQLSLTRIILLTLALIILLMPQSLYSASFWLSFYAVVVITTVSWRFFSSMSDVPLSWSQRVMRWGKHLVILQTLLTLLMLPVVLLLSQSFSVNVLLANLVAIPLVSFVCLPLTLVSVLSLLISNELASQLLELSVWSLEILWQWLTLVSRGFETSTHVSSIQWLLCCVCGILVIGSYHLRFYLQQVIRHSKPRMYAIAASVGSAMLLVVILWDSDRTRDKQRWRTYVLDVGQGLAMVIIKNNRAILYDTGASFPSGFNMVDSVIVPFLTYHGVSTLDYVIVSHLDNDHAGGLSRLTALNLTEQLIANMPNVSSTVNVSSCTRGNQIVWQGLSFDVLWPQTARGQENDDSCVIKVDDGQHSVLLTGDISKRVERELVALHQRDNILDVDVLIAPHHGSNSSSDDIFINATSPQEVIFSAGYLNRWKHPKSTVVKRYLQQDIKSYATAENGMLAVEFSNDSYHVYRYRQDLWPFWFAN